uniref:Uncharacterized protein n=1 Tax=Timema monikensis TaxID=170555 RepID=A0A7R9HTB5_9NEOP|nr:unnamed protein product [Timema monikensis]
MFLVPTAINCGIQIFSRSMGCIVKVNTTVEYPECCPIHYCPKSKSSRFEHTIKDIPQELRALATSYPPPNKNNQLTNYTNTINGRPGYTTTWPIVTLTPDQHNYTAHLNSYIRTTRLLLEY